LPEYIQRHTDRNRLRSAWRTAAGEQDSMPHRPAQATISRHLGVLRTGGVVIRHRHAQDIVYQIANPKIVSICDLMRELLIEQASSRSKLVEGFQDEYLE
jgi:hypothetical protein